MLVLGSSKQNIDDGSGLSSDIKPANMFIGGGDPTLVDIFSFLLKLGSVLFFLLSCLILLIMIYTYANLVLTDGRGVVF
jgi:hypothetical protein